MVLRVSKRQKINKKMSKKNNVVKNQYGGTWDELFTREFGTAGEVGVQLGIRPNNGVSIIDPETYRLICNRLRQARDRLNDMDHLEHYSVYYRAIKFFVHNVNLLFISFLTRQPALGISKFYFHFNDGQLYPNPVHYNDFDDLEQVEHMIASFDTPAEQSAFRQTVGLTRVPNFAESRPQYNNIVISSIFITTHLLDNISRVLHTLNNNLQYHRAHNNLTPAQIQQTNELIATTRQEYLTIIREIIPSFLGTFTTNLVNILTSTEPKDIAYISVLNTDVTHLYTLLVNLPKCAEVIELLNPIVLHLYLKRDLPQRFSFLKCIINNPALFRLLALDERYTYVIRRQDMITLLDTTLVIPGQTAQEREKLFLNLIDNTISAMRSKNYLKFNQHLGQHRAYYDLWTAEFADVMTHFNMNSNAAFSGLIPKDINLLITTICNKVNNLLDIPAEILELAANEKQQYIDDINTQSLLFLFFTRVIIFNNMHILDTFLVCFLANTLNSVVININVNLALRTLALNIVGLCYSNRNFKNYLANQMISAHIPHYNGITILMGNDEILTSIRRDFQNLEVFSADPELRRFECNYTQLFILKLGVITAMNIDLNTPVTPFELEQLQNIDLFSVMKHVYIFKTHPLNGLPMTLDDLEKLQLRYQAQIAVLINEKAQLMRAALN